MVAVPYIKLRWAQKRNEETSALFVLSLYRVVARSNICSGDFIARRERYTYFSYIIASVIGWTRTLTDHSVDFSMNEHTREKDGNKSPDRQDWRERQSTVCFM
jgi:hypothetical protein